MGSRWPKSRVWLVVEEKNSVVVAVEVITNEEDSLLLVSMIDEVERNLGRAAARPVTNRWRTVEQVVDQLNTRQIDRFRRSRQRVSAVGRDSWRISNRTVMGSGGAFKSWESILTGPEFSAQNEYRATMCQACAV